MTRAANRVAMIGYVLCAWIGHDASAADVAPRLEAFPSAVRLDHRLDAQGLVLRIVQPDGLTRDCAAAATIESADPSIAAVAGTLVSPVADGATTLTVRVGELSAAVPVAVRNAARQPPLSFRNDVVATLTKAGCNNGSCHGSARGQDGFHLSLFGYDPAGDYERITRELPGRRINLALPTESLLLAKATNTVPHTGGLRIESGGEGYATLLGWLRAGAPGDAADVPTVVDLELFPQDIVLECGASQRLGVRARYSDGSDRDVTSLAVLLCSNEQVGTVRGDALHAGQRGEAQIMARFDALTVGTQVIVIPPDAAVRDEAFDSANYIDDAVHAKLRRLRIEPSGLCSDAEFLRRVYLDIVGLLPPHDAVEPFVADPSPGKRAALVDELLSRKEFVEIWVMKWAERLAIRSSDQVSYKAMLLYYNWLSERIAANQPIDQIVRELIAADGGTFTHPAANFYQLEPDTLKTAENVAQAFLGTRIQCAQCHNHPFDRWTMNDYYGFAAFFAQIGRKSGEDPRETIVFNSGEGQVKHPVDGRVLAPRFLGGPTPDLAGVDRRRALAEWLTSPDNRMFARNVANFVWAHFFARGIVEPVDDVRVSNPPVNPALLDALAARLVESRYDLRGLIRDICASHTYQRATTPNPTNADDRSNFSHAQVRRIRAEVLLDCIGQATGTHEKFPGLPLGARAVQIADGATSTYFLSAFGRAQRDTVCTCEVRMEPSLSQALHLINGHTVHERIKQGGVVRKLLDSGRKPEDVLAQMFLTCLARRPTADEFATLSRELGPAPDGAAAADPVAVLEDALWALLNSKEFLFNH